MNIIALDLAEKCGWCTPTASGVWNLKPKSYESAGMKLIKFKSSLIELIQSERPDLIAYEKPGGRNYNGIRSGANFEGVLQTICLENEINYHGFSAGEIKKHATGKGNCNKEAMIQAAKLYFPETQIIDDNHADALWIFDLAKTRFK